MNFVGRASARFARALAAAVLALTICGAAAAQARDWPDEGRIAYRVLRGENGLALGEARHRWSHDGKRYRMETVVETTGLAAMLYRFHYVQRSEGRVLADDGLRPDRFVVERAGQESEVASFDWAAKRVKIRRKGKDRLREGDLRAGDQDVLSLLHELGRIARRLAGPAELTVVSNKVAAPSVLEVVGRESIQVPLGRIDALRVKARAKDGSLVLDVWLDESRGMLPVRVVMTDDKGEVLDQQAVAVDVGKPASGDKGK